MPVNEDEELGPDGKKIRPGISATVISELTDCNASLSQQRKKRQVFDDNKNLFKYHYFLLKKKRKLVNG